MKYAFYPGCVAKGACPELKMSTETLMNKLDIELIELKDAACTGAGVISEHEQELADTLNARTFAMAEKIGAPLMNICSTCQGNMSRSNNRLKNDSSLLKRVNETLSEEGFNYSGNLSVKNLLWILVEDYGLDKLKEKVTNPLKGLKVAPFYGCYILRPTWDLGFKEYPARGHYLEKLIEVCGGEAVDYSGKDKCCGFPILTMNKKNSYAMTANHLQEAKSKDADCMVTPCPLCHLNLDANQPDVAKTVGTKIDLPVLHLPQLIGLALGISQYELGLDRNIIDTKNVLSAVS
ncbi:MAG: CoB--CoM heterodisulfide reductase iron-sulfur subunit B family protein [Spirochaetota bacterium]|nr:CoB--CoM heterodisulfide reductase iron-sulfur subunit B family protein [Spirochaetota bacterium]